MSPDGDDMDEMFELPIAGGIADALLEGRVEPEDAPPGLQEVATFVLAARSLNANGDLAGENSVVPAFVESIRAQRATSALAGTSIRRSGRALSAKVAGLAAVLAFGGATAAAATGSLPNSVQAALSRNLSHVGINVPDPQSRTSHPGTGKSGSAASSGGQGNTTSATGPSTTANEYGLCTAYSAPDGRASSNTTRGSALTSTAFSRLSAAASARGESVQEFCAGVTKPGASASSSSSSDSTSSGTSSPQGGPPATNPSGNTPGGPPATNPSGKTPGSPATNADGNSQGPPATTPGGNTPTPGGNTPEGSSNHNNSQGG